jgi:hypothetical protein
MMAVAESKRNALLLIALLTCGFTTTGPAMHAAANQDRPVPASSTPSSVRAALDRYCVTCHNARIKTANLMLDRMDAARVSESPEIWEEVVQKLRTGTMPPAAAPRPDRATYDRLIASLETDLDRASAGSPFPGRSPVRRLNRAEYANAVRDLLSLDVDVTSLLPPDDSAYGFDNIADLLGLSPVLLERYLNAAGTISALAVGDPTAGPGSETYLVRQDLSQDQHLEGQPLGTVGGTLVRHTFPLDGEYVFQVKLFRTNTDAARGLQYPHELEMTVDGERVYLGFVGGDADFRALYAASTVASNTIDSRLQVRVPVKAGPHTVGVAFLEKSAVLDTRLLRPFVRSSADTYDFTGLPHISALTIVGPFDPAGAGDTPSRRQIFICRPASAKGFGGAGPVSADELPCARKILSRLARRGYRQPATADDVEPLLEFFKVGRRQGTFDAGIEQALQRLLAGPKFVFRLERDPANVAPGVAYRVGDHELASRLSFFLWSSIPDDELLKLARRGKLRDAAVFEQQVRRMLADPKSQALVDNFGDQWLQVRNLRNIVPNSNEFPDFDDNLRQAFQRETELFFGSIIREDRNVLDLMTADYSFVNERLARHYGIPDIYGSQFRRVTMSDDARRGLLGKGSVLMVTSHADRTSPVVRGKWILENILNTPVPPPLPNVPALKEHEEDQRPRTMREQMAEHRANPVCATCHQLMDPVGFALENFDAVGAWRMREVGVPIDATGQLVDGTKVDGVVTLRKALLSRPDVFVSTITQKLLTYALGRGVTYGDMPTVRGIVRQSAPGYRFSSIVLGIVRSAPFQMRTARGEQR